MLFRKHSLFVILVLISSFSCTSNKQKRRENPFGERRTDPNHPRQGIDAQNLFSPIQFTKNDKFVKFNVANVMPIDQKEEWVAPKDFLKEKFRYVEAASSNWQPFLDLKDGQDVMINTRFVHPFVRAADYAYNNHRPLMISPDQIWHLILQGISIHVNREPEKFRKLLVNHGKKLKLIARYTPRKEVDWDEIIDEFSALILKNSNPTVTDLLSLHFSTSKPHNIAARTVTLMETMKEYYEYQTYPKCGIPYFILQGTTSDWLAIQGKLQILSSFDLAWWQEALQPVINEFVNASQGSINQAFWDNMVTESSGYGMFHLNGWINKLFPYTVASDLGDLPPETIKNKKKIEAEFIRNRFDSSHSLKDYSTGLSIVTVEHNYEVKGRMLKKRLEVISGFFGVQKDAQGVLFADTGWLIRNPKSPIIFRNRTDTE